MSGAPAFLIFDTETTGKDAQTAALVEVAGLVIDADGQEISRFHSLANPGVPIPYVASAIHHLVDSDVADAPPAGLVRARFLSWRAGFPTAVPTAHNAKYDTTILGIAGPALCTWRLARHLWPSAESHSNQALRYFLGLQIQSEGLAPHRAMADVLVTAGIAVAALQHQLQDNPHCTAQDLRDLAASPITVTHLTFGKHKDKSLTETPADYLQWIVTKMDDPDPDLLASVKGELQRRRSGCRPG